MFCCFSIVVNGSAVRRCGAARMNGGCGCDDARPENRCFFCGALQPAALAALHLLHEHRHRLRLCEELGGREG